VNRVIVVGSGIAGLTVALHAARAGARVSLITKDVLEHANTRYAQGGIAGVMFDDDRLADHARDTLAAGAGLCDPAAVEVLVSEGPTRIRELIDLGVAFDRDDEGTLVRGLEAAHSYPRILHAGGDATGTAIEQALVAAVRAARVRILEHAFLVDLLVATAADGTPVVTGVELLTPGGRVNLRADAIVLATGGAGQLFAHTTNPSVATGDGIAAARRAGVETSDLEFVQFHPTVLATGAPFLVSEAVRGEGAILVDDEGRRFLFDTHPDGELAPRDIVARAIADRMTRQGGGAVFLDATRLGSASGERASDFLPRRFPSIDAAVRERGLDWAREPIPVTPAAHYLMGGIVTDLDGRTSLPGLYAVGEAARTGVHGANRLASNSLLEGAVFGARVAKAVLASPESTGRSASAVRRSACKNSAPKNSDMPQSGPPHAGAVPRFSRAALQSVMWNEVGVVRDEAGLRHAETLVATWLAQSRSPRTPTQLEDENLLQLGAAVIAAALARPRSVGAHHRRDDPPIEPAPVAVLAGSATC